MWRVQSISFLSALPALLGLAGFVLYQVLGANKSGDAISRRIIDKLRAVAPDEVPTDQRLDARQVERLIQSRHRLQEIVGKQDFELLHQALSQQFIITILAYILTLCFCSWSVFLFVRTNPKTTTIPEPMPPIVQKSGENGTNVISNGGGPVSVQKDASTTNATAPNAVERAVSRTKAAGPSSKLKDRKTER
jgi:hypothetical protein